MLLTLATVARVEGPAVRADGLLNAIPPRNDALCALQKESTDCVLYEGPQSGHGLRNVQQLERKPTQTSALRKGRANGSNAEEHREVIRSNACGSLNPTDCTERRETGLRQQPTV